MRTKREPSRPTHVEYCPIFGARTARCSRRSWRSRSSSRASRRSSSTASTSPAVHAAEVERTSSFQASKDLRIGNYYFKKGNYSAAAHRFEEATKWDGTNAEAYLRLGEAKEKQHERKAAAEAYAKYLEIAPDAKDAPEVKKRLEKVHK